MEDLTELLTEEIQITIDEIQTSFDEKEESCWTTKAILAVVQEICEQKSLETTKLRELEIETRKVMETIEQCREKLKHISAIGFHESKRIISEVITIKGEVTLEYGRIVNEVHDEVTRIRNKIIK